MVGVPGKYKGCETCRLRRVKCDNTRPFCRKCLDGGRTCAGYERETVFIVGTIEDQGRCSSHPPRVVKPREEKAARATASASSSKAGAAEDQEGQDEGNLELVPSQPLCPAWDDLVSVLCLGKTYRLQVAGLYTDLEKHTTSHLSNQPTWQDSSAQTNTICRVGPEAFQSFPAHHFFVRVYRPSAIMTALLNRTPTYLSEPQWLTTPFEEHPKSPLDHLLDSLSALPALLGQADRVLSQQRTLARRLMAQDLLNNCLDLELDLGRWYSTTTQTLGGHQPLFWLADPSAAAAAAPGEVVTAVFPAPLLSFRAARAALAMGYYWTALVVLYPTAWRLYFAAVLDPVVDVDLNVAGGFLSPLAQADMQTQQQGIGIGLGSYETGMGMGMGSRDVGVPGSGILPVPARLQALDPMRYSLAKTREVAGNVCRAMEFLLAETCVQPDLMLHMLLVVERFFRENGDMGMNMGLVIVDGGLELMWCEGFRARLVARAREMQAVGPGRRWVDLASF
ncbi:hypothetical protein N657DRAFT_633843 [Parathielavia appendiculata]|uniref:Zn(2)-C6 fungal-type domain-containing protein n=1 Tax=Parathielavia appendiculata TaxID=2587402 RepID=A0AAN6U0A6_9PEZI|nr:hypothetical protein N657DRAFT_633843 [Parathielavia appendiculata]